MLLSWEVSPRDNPNQGLFQLQPHQARDVPAAQPTMKLVLPVPPSALAVTQFYAPPLPSKQKAAPPKCGPHPLHIVIQIYTCQMLRSRYQWKRSMEGG